MASSWVRRPLVVVAVTDLVLMAVVGSPWVADWALAGQLDPSRTGRAAVAELLFPAWGASDTGVNALELAQMWDRWRAGVIFRIVAFLLLHLWVVRMLAHAAGPLFAWRGARTGAWILAPAVGALAGLATVIPGAFDPSTTVVDREDLRLVAVTSLRDGAYWGLAAGAVCVIVLAVASLFARRAPDSPASDTDEDEETAKGVGLVAAVSALLAAVAVASVLGGPAVVRASLESDSLLASDLAGIVSYFRWWIPEPDPFSIPALAYVPTLALAVYLVALALVLAAFPGGRADAPAHRAFARGWHAATWTAITGALYIAAQTMVLSAFYGSESYPGASLYRAMVHGALAELPNAAAYAALLGWAPALAVLGAVRLVQWAEADEAEDTEAEDTEAEDTEADDAPPAG